MIDFKKELEIARDEDKKIHNVFNNVIETNLESVKEFLKGKYDVKILEDDEHSLKTLRFIAPEIKGWNNEFNFSFEYIQSKVAFDSIESIQKELIKFVIGLVR